MTRAITLPAAPWDTIHEAVLAEGRAKPSREEAILIAQPAPAPVAPAKPARTAPSAKPKLDGEYLAAAVIALLDDLTETKRRLDRALGRIAALETEMRRRRAS